MTEGLYSFCSEAVPCVQDNKVGMSKAHLLHINHPKLCSKSINLKHTKKWHSQRFKMALATGADGTKELLQGV